MEALSWKISLITVDDLGSTGVHAFEVKRPYCWSHFVHVYIHIYYECLGEYSINKKDFKKMLLKVILSKQGSSRGW